MIHTFKKNGYSFTLVKESGHVALYKGVRGGAVTWEVHVVRTKKRPQSWRPGPDPIEVHPSNNEWGRLGWTFTSLPKAEAKMSEVVARIASKQGPKPI